MKEIFSKRVPGASHRYRDETKRSEKTSYEAYLIEGQPKPKVKVEQQCQYCNFAMVRMQGLGAEHTQVLINGRPMYSGLAGVL